MVDAPVEPFPPICPTRLKLPAVNELTVVWLAPGTYWSRPVEPRVTHAVVAWMETPGMTAPFVRASLDGFDESERTMTPPWDRSVATEGFTKSRPQR
jgi:hypothetical protein